MSKLLILVGFMSLSSAAFAETTLKCKLKSYVATSSGLVSAESASITSALLDKYNPQKTVCGTSEALGLKIILCAQDSDYTLGYDIFVDTPQAGNSRGFETLSMSTYQSSRQNSQLELVQKSSQILLSTVQKLRAGGIDTTGDLSLDAPGINAAVARGVQKGLLRSGDIAGVLIEGCKLSR